MSDAVLQQILNRIRTVDQNLDILGSRLTLLEHVLTSRLEALEAMQRAWLLRHDPTASLLSPARAPGTLVDATLQQRIADLSGRITKLEFGSSSRPHST